MGAESDNTIKRKGFQIKKNIDFRAVGDNYDELPLRKRRKTTTITIKISATMTTTTTMTTSRRPHWRLWRQNTTTTLQYINLSSLDGRAVDSCAEGLIPVQIYICFFIVYTNYTHAIFACSRLLIVVQISYVSFFTVPMTLPVSVSSPKTIDSIVFSKY